MMFFLSISTLASLVAPLFLDFLRLFLIFLVFFISVSIFISWFFFLFFPVFLLTYGAIIPWSSSFRVRRYIRFIRRILRFTFIWRLIPIFFIFFWTLLLRPIDFSLRNILVFRITFSLIIALFDLFLLSSLCCLFTNIFFGRIFCLVGFFLKLLHSF